WRLPQASLTNTAATWNSIQKPAKAPFFESFCPRPPRINYMSKVLLIEDEKSIASALKRVLEGSGHEVFAALDSKQGLAAARTGDFQVVVTDLKMPGLSGMDVIKSLHDTKPRLPVILMTGHHTTETAIEAMKFGAYECNINPPDPA